MSIPFVRAVVCARSRLHSVTDETEVPESYEFPFLKWLHGLDLECTLNATTLESRLELAISAGGDADFAPIPRVAANRR